MTWGCAELTFHPVDLCRNWSGISARPWALIPSRCDCCLVLATGPHRREKLGHVLHWQIHRVVQAVWQGSTWGRMELTFRPADLCCNWSRILARPWALILLGCDWCQVPAAGPHRREKLGQVLHWQCTECGTWSLTWVYSRPCRIDVPPCRLKAWLVGDLAKAPGFDSAGVRLLPGPGHRSPQEGEVGPTSPLAMHRVSLMGAHSRPGGINIPPFGLKVRLVGDLPKTPGFDSAGVRLTQGPSRRSPQEGEVGPTSPLAMNRVWWGSTRGHL